MYCRKWRKQRQPKKRCLLIKNKLNRYGEKHGSLIGKTINTINTINNTVGSNSNTMASDNNISDNTNINTNNASKISNASNTYQVQRQREIGESKEGDDAELMNQDSALSDYIDRNQ